MDRREFTKIMGAVVAGMVAGSRLSAEETKKAAAGAPAVDKHVCKGHNECKGKGGCKADPAKCAAGKNECKGMGGCKTAAGCAGKNECKGKGGCKVPLDATHVDKKEKSSCKGKSGCKSR